MLLYGYLYDYLYGYLYDYLYGYLYDYLYGYLYDYLYDYLFMQKLCLANLRALESLGLERY